MITRKDRLRILTERVKNFNSEILKLGLQAEYEELVLQISNGELKLKPIYDETWDLMLPDEQKKYLLTYYHTLRSEAQMLIDGIKQQGPVEKASQWLDNPWVKRGVTLTAIVKVAIDVANLVATSGVFYQEGDSDRII